MNKKLHKSLEEYNKIKEDTVIPISGTLGIPLNGQKLVEVPNRQGFVYVKLKDNTSEVIQAYNSTVSTTYDLPVLVVRSNNVYRVLGRNLDLYRDWGNIPYLPKHGGQHSFNPMLSMGADITWIYSQQIMPLLGYPSGTDGSPRISIAPYLIRDLSGNWKYAGNTGTISTTIYNPNTGSRAVMALVYLDTVSGNPYLLVNSGTYISDSLTGTNQIAPYIPQLTNPNHLPIAAIRLLSGTSTLTWNNIYDARPFLQVVPTGSSGSGPITTPVTGSIVLLHDWVIKGSIPAINFSLGLNANLSGTYGDINVDFGTGTFQSLRGSTIPYDIGAIPNDGWIKSNLTWTYLLSDSPIFVASINSTNVTGTIGIGDRVKLDQTTTKYFMVHAVGITGSTSYLTLYGGTDYVLQNAAITNPYYSPVKYPFGFPTNSDVWTVTFTDTSNASQASPTIDTFYNPGSLFFSGPIGLWRVYSHISNEVRANLSGGAGNLGCRCGISNITGSISYPQFTRESLSAAPNINPALHRFSATCSGELLLLTAKTNLFLLTSTSQTATQLNFRGDLGGLTTSVKLIDAYL